MRVFLLSLSHESQISVHDAQDMRKFLSDARASPPVDMAFEHEAEARSD
jgi:hypothetical protein